MPVEKKASTLMGVSRDFGSEHLRVVKVWNAHTAHTTGHVFITLLRGIQLLLT